jgi:hypothetical protein
LWVILGSQADRVIVTVDAVPAASPLSATAGTGSRRGGMTTIPAAAKAMDRRTKSLCCLWQLTMLPLSMRRPWPLQDYDNGVAIDDKVDTKAESTSARRSDTPNQLQHDVGKKLSLHGKTHSLTVFIPADVDVHSRRVISVKTLSNLLCNFHISLQFSYQFAITISVRNSHI